MDGGTLMTYVSGRAVKLLQEKKDSEVIALCMQVLRKMFPEEVYSAKPHLGAQIFLVIDIF